MPFAKINGTQLFYLEVGQGLPCLVMHGGLGFDHTYLHPWLDPLQDTLRLIYYDHRGNGRSGRPPVETLTFDQLAADADALRAHLGCEMIGIIGHSFGGFIALQYALLYTRRVSHLILLDTAPAWDYADEIVANATRKGASEEILALLDLEQCTTDAQLECSIPRISFLYYHRFDPGVAERVFSKTIFSGSATGRGGQLLRDYNVANRLSEITAPALIITGRDDFLTPPSQSERLKKGIPNAELMICEQSGHFPYIEKSEVFFTAVRQWVDRHR